MKKYLILLFLAVLASCTKDLPDDLFSADGRYSMTVQASKEGTKALGLSGSTLNATWAKDEEVSVYNVTKGAALSGTLKAQSSGSSTTLKGELTGTIEPNDELTLKFLSPNYSSQTGTLAYIAANCDYAEATIHVKSISGGNITIKESSASFVNQQAIVKFTLKNNSNTAISATALTVSATNPAVLDANHCYSVTYSYTVTPTSAASEFYVAVPGISEQTLNLTATVGSDTYVYQKSGKSFTNGQYYEIAVKMPKLYPASNITFLRGRTGASTGGNEGMGNLLDGNKSNKWCSLYYGPATYPIRVSNYQSGIKDQVIWKTASGIILTNYMLTTGGDSYRTSPNRRNWKSWTIYGANFSSDNEATIDAVGWTKIQQITDDNVLQDVNHTDFWFSIPGNNTAYQYYRIVIDEIKDDCNIHQMSEMTLFTK
ncbi:MAG: hypothetical protein IKX45_06755 [Bacteroidales bacterium]|nr:hypothetical protein [Bacteroidales bacterium]